MTNTNQTSLTAKNLQPIIATTLQNKAFQNTSVQKAADTKITKPLSTP